MIPMKIDTAFFTALILAGTTLWARIAVQGVEQALVLTGLEHCVSLSKKGWALKKSRKNLSE
jgi:hypothetical protein